MNENKEVRLEEGLAYSGLAAVTVALLITAATSGCAAPALLGVKSYQSGDTRVEFITGADFGFALNGTDTVNNQRGISPQGGYSRARTIKTKIDPD